MPCAVAPDLLFGIIAGPIADQGNRRFLIIGGNVAEGLLVATIPVAHALGVPTVAQVYVVGLLSATAFVFSDAAVFGAVPALVGPERLRPPTGSSPRGFRRRHRRTGPSVARGRHDRAGQRRHRRRGQLPRRRRVAADHPEQLRTGSVPAGERLPIKAQVKRARASCGATAPWPP